MKEKLEKLAVSIFKEMEKDGEPVTMEQAREMAEMEMNSKELCRRYEKSDKPRATAVTREKKVDENKKRLLEKLYLTLKQMGIVGEQQTSAINFNYNGDSYSLKLVKHRKKKA